MTFSKVTKAQLENFRDHREPHYLYRCYDADGRLIYIGCTVEPKKRMRVHKAQSSNRASVLLQCFMARWEADFDALPGAIAAHEHEAAAIQAERPVFNVQESRRPYWMHARDLLAYIYDHEPNEGTADRLCPIVTYLERLVVGPDDLYDTPLTTRERKALAMNRISEWVA